MTHAAERPDLGRVAKAATRPEQQVFYWMPVAGDRHAICGESGSHEPGELGQTLCGESVEIRAAAETEWFTWPTCDKCWQVAKSVLGELKRTRPRLW